MSKLIKDLLISTNREDLPKFKENFDKIVAGRVRQMVKTGLFESSCMKEEDEEGVEVGTGRCPKCKEGASVIKYDDGEVVSNCCSADMGNEEWEKS